MARRKRKAPIGCLFWIACILLVIVVFLLNRKTINSVLESTGLTELLAPGESTEKEPFSFKLTRKNTEDKNSTSEEAEDNNEPDNVDDTTSVPETKRNDNEDRSTDEEIPNDTRTQIAIEIPAHETDSTEVSRTTENTGEYTTQKFRHSKLYFILIDNDKSQLKSITRSIDYVDAPLTRTMESLLQGPSTSDLNMGMISLIPKDTRINSITVKDQIAYIDFSEEFRFNTFGVEGATYQIMQIVFTATEFPTVKKVQFTIGGEKYDYLAQEGINIGSPIGREDF